MLLPIGMQSYLFGTAYSCLRVPVAAWACRSRLRPPFFRLLGQSPLCDKRYTQWMAKFRGQHRTRLRTRFTHSPTSSARPSCRWRALLPHRRHHVLGKEHGRRDADARRPRPGRVHEPVGQDSLHAPRLGHSVSCCLPPPPFGKGFGGGEWALNFALVWGSFIIFSLLIPQPTVGRIPF